MKQPAYKPETWVLFQQGETGGYGHVIGASFENGTWLYTVAGSLGDGSTRAVREEDITQLLQSGSWQAISVSAGNGGSAYQDQNAS